MQCQHLLQQSFLDMPGMPVGDVLPVIILDKGSNEASDDHGEVQEDDPRRRCRMAA